MKNVITLHTCASPDDFEIAKCIARDYMKWLNMDLDFQNIEKEFSGFSEMYGSPNGCYIIAKDGESVIGGVGIRKIEPEVCEMKRLFVYENNQGRGIGKLLCNRIIEIASTLGYKKMRLDTVSKLESANLLYEKIGFKDIPAYYYNPDSTARFMEKQLII